MQHTLTRLTLLSSILILSSVTFAEDTLVIDIKGSKKAASPNEVKPLSAERSAVLPADGGDFLKQLNGVSGSRFGGRGIEPIIRGQSQTQLNVLLDGAYVHGGCPNRMDPPASWAALETYEKVTVEKGVQTLQHGSGGSGGTVLFERDTRSIIDPEDGWSGKASATTMSNGVKHDISADVTKAFQKGYARVFTQDRDAGNYEDGDGKEVRSSYKHKQAGVVLGATPTADRLIEYSFENNDFSDALYPGASMDSPEESGSIQRLKYQDKLDGKVNNVDAEVYLSEVDHLMDNYSLRPQTGTKMAVPTTSDTTGGKLALKSTVGNTDITYGLNVQNRERDAVMKNMSMPTTPATNLMWPGATTDQSGIFAEATTQNRYGGQAEIRPAGGSGGCCRLQSRCGGGRAHRQPELHRAFTATVLLIRKKPMSAACCVTKNPSMLTPPLSRVQAVPCVLRMKPNASSINGAQPLPTAGLATPISSRKSTTSLTLALASNAARCVGQARYSPTRWTISSCVTKWLAAHKRAHKSTAMSMPNILGAELGAETKLNDKLRLSGDVAYVKRTNTTDDRPIAQTPPLNGKVQLDYNGGKWSGGTRVRFAAGQDRIDTAMVGATEVGNSTGYGVVDAYGRYSINKSTKVRFGVDNLLDKTYAEHVSRRNLDLGGTIERVNEAGRSAWLKLETEF